MRKVIFILGFFFLSFSNLTSQNLAQKLNQLAESSTLVFEGVVIGHECFWDDSGKRILTANTVEVFNWIKGSSADRTITVHTSGGIVGEDFQIYPHGLHLDLGENGVFFTKTFSIGRKSSQYLMPNGREGFKKTTIIGNERYIIDEEGQGIALSQVIQSVSTKTDEETPLFFPPDLATIEFGFTNFQFDFSQSKVEFDIEARTNIEGLKYAGGNVLLDYPTNVFGSSLVINSGIEVTKEQITSNQSYSLFLSDNDTNTVNILTSISCESVSDMSALSTSFRKLVHVEAEIENMDAIGEISLDQFLMVGNVYYYDPESNDCVPFDDVFVPNGFNPLLMPDIISFWPNPITAGTGDTLTIRGINFGPDKGKVKFPNADDLGATLMEAQNADVSWSDTLIKLRMPSIELSSKPGGTGIFEVVRTDNMSATSDSVLRVKYAVINVRDAIDFKAYRVHLTGGSFDDISFEYEDTLALIQDSLPVEIIELSLEKWRCATGVKWNLLGQSNLHLPDGSDGTNLILMGHDTLFLGDLADAIAYTAISGRIMQCSNMLRFFTRDIDIVIRESENWWYDANPNDSPVQLGALDFQSNMLHELGHAHKHDHVIAPTQVMHSKLPPSTPLRQLHAFDIEGGLNVIDSAQMLAGCTSAGGAQQILPIGQEFCGPNSTHEEKAMNSIKAYPTIFDERINIEFHLNKPIPVRISILDLLGRIIYDSKIEHTYAGHNSLILPSTDISCCSVYFLRLSAEGQQHTQKLLKLNR